MTLKKELHDADVKVCNILFSLTLNTLNETSKEFRREMRNKLVDIRNLIAAEENRLNLYSEQDKLLKQYESEWLKKVE